MLDIIDEALLAAWNSSRTGGAALLAGFEAAHLARANAAPPDKTDYRQEAESAIRRLVSDAFPEHRIVSALDKGGNPLPDGGAPVWYIDSLDGAFNYNRNSPFFSISIGLAVNDGRGGVKPLVGVVLAPAMMEMFWAAAGEGAHYCQQIPGIGLTDGAMSVSDTGKLDMAVVKTGLKRGPDEKGEIERQNRVQGAVMSFSREASASLNIAHVAAGRADCFYSSSLSPVTAIPAALLVEEAGGQASDFCGRPFSLRGDTELAVSNRILHGKLLELIAGECKGGREMMVC
jgi:myo-inositol-1(or 4)-monophosphatase